jgi:antitoxin HicB
MGVRQRVRDRPVRSFRSRSQRVRSLVAAAARDKVRATMSIVADDTVRHYLNLPYRIALVRDGLDDERPWRAAVEELPGCEARGSTAPEAAARVPAALAEWVASAQAEGREIPEPRDARAYSGKLLLRMPQSLHAELAQAAERDQVSLNAHINLLLAAAVHASSAHSLAEVSPRAEDDVGEGAAAGMQRALTFALIANVAVVATVAVIAVVLLVSA